MSMGYDVGRSEHKYLVNETTAVALRSFVRAYLTPDHYMPAGDSEGYHVHSLYLDSPWHELYRETTEGVKNRYKLRMRFYDEAPQAPVFLEVKSRTTDAIHKLRAIVSKSSATALLSGMTLTTQDLISPTEKSIIALEEFRRRMTGLAARGCAFVSYRREAYVGFDLEEVRVTFDRHIAGLPYDPTNGFRLPTERAEVFPDQVVVELKYSGRVPKWMRELVRDFGLQRTSFPKYVHAVDALQLRPGQNLANARGVA
jgi:hypothetical protein